MESGIQLQLLYCIACPGKDYSSLLLSFIRLDKTQHAIDRD